MLKTIPWDKVDIEVMAIETNHAGEIFPGTKQEIRDYLADKGYVYAHTVGRISVNTLWQNIYPSYSLPWIS